MRKALVIGVLMGVVAVLCCSCGLIVYALRAVSGAEPRGCLAIYDLETGQTRYVPWEAFREVVVDARPEYTNFFTLIRVGEAQLELRERDENGRLLSRRVLPFFREGYAGREWLAMSPDRKFLVYIDHDKTEYYINVLDLDSMEVRRLATGVPEPHSLVKYLEVIRTNTAYVLWWFSSRPTLERLNFFDGQYLAANVDLTTGAITPAGKWERLDSALWSPDRQKVAVFEDTKFSKSLVVYRAEDKKELVEFEERWDRRAKWLDDKHLVIGCDGIFLYEITDGGVKERVIAKEEEVWLRLVVGEWIVYETGGLHRPERYWLHNVHTGERKRLRLAINGGVFGIAGNKKLVAEVGF